MDEIMYDVLDEMEIEKPKNIVKGKPWVNYVPSKRQETGPSTLYQELLSTLVKAADESYIHGNRYLTLTAPQGGIKSERERHFYYYDGNYYSVTPLSNSLVVHSQIADFIFHTDVDPIRLELILHDNHTEADVTEQILGFSVCIGVSLLLHERKVNVDTRIVYKGDKKTVEELSYMCEPFNTKKLVIQRKADISKLPGTYIKKIKEKVQRLRNNPDIRSNLQKIEIITPIREKSEQTVYKYQTLVGIKPHTFYINALRIDNGEFMFNRFVTKSRYYIESLSLLDQMTIVGYTFVGDQIINDFIQNNFQITQPVIDNILKTINDRFKVQKTSIVNKQFPFFSQIFELFYPQDEKITPDLYNYILDHLYQPDWKKENFINSINTENWTRVLNRYIEDLRRILKHAPETEFNMVLFRGTGRDTTFKYKETKGNVIVNNQFKSASLDFSVAMSFTGIPEKDTRYRCCLVRFIIPKKFKLLYIGSVSSFGGEHEVLINIDTHMSVRENSEIDIGQYIYRTTDLTMIK